MDKPYGRACPNLLADFGCGIHDQLRERGFAGCVAFDCLGAGQHTTAAFEGRSWRSDPGIAPLMFDVFYFMREFHSMLWSLDQALRLPVTAGFRGEVQTEIERVVAVSDLPPEELSGTHVDDCARRVDELIRTASAQARQHLSHRRGLHRANLRDADLRGADLRGADLTEATLIGARLHGADLRWADLRGAVLSKADLRGADLSSALFLGQSQLESATGDGSTRLPAGRRRPAHWASGSSESRTDG
jgi:hypothetical protein